ncbi:tol-pal system protein YbgF [Reichenbachiella carrageenanivorans]|uniref:Tol-pal system protein YbgF n=1 Tax=Reichenbachiella carrageenanivorans TaxID=2979869 RepID=A0ABY6D4N2_9BACT|nr:tol-pal system protein YbgF [Reichenbachiella carrageenanivorans]UXX81119.1 tol-pal system protein YbgF [Reichenbachiella carrageenanivorans]
MRTLSLLVVFTLSLAKLSAQTADSIPVLLTDTEIQIECTEGINSMYNFDFKRADSQFRWLKGKYGWHPLPYFLLGLSQWWRIVPNIQNTQYDSAFIAYMDSTILVAENIFDHGSEVEGGFFLSAAYAFKGRLYAERHAWRKAATAGKNAMKYLDYCRDQEEFGPEILFGDALYNYYSVWIPENYPILKPIMMFFRDGDKELGLSQLKEVANYAFFTRTEAQYFLMRIMANEEHDRRSALFISQYLHETFPNNSYFHRFYARMLYSSGQYSKAEKEAKSIIAKIDQNYTGYEQNSGRYAAFFLGEINAHRDEPEVAESYYKLCVKYGDEIGAQRMGYYLYSVLNLGRYAADRGDKELAKEQFKKVKKLSDKKDRTYDLAKDYLKSL